MNEDQTLFAGEILGTNHPDYVVHDRAIESATNFGKVPPGRVEQLKSELRLKMAARYGNRHDRRQAEAMGRKAATKAKHLAWKKALQKGTPVSATLLPNGAHQPGILNSAQWAVRQLARDINDWRVEEVQAHIPGVAWVDAGGSGTEIDS